MNKKSKVKKKPAKRKVKKLKANSRVLCVSDLHYPYSHPDANAFLQALTDKYQFDKIVLLGDEIDGHALSYHETDPDLLSAGQEMEASLELMEELYEMWDGISVTVVDSNHGALGKRKAKTAGIPKKFLKSPEDLYDAPNNWEWVDDHILTLSNGKRCLFTHGKSSEIMRVVSSWSISTVSGHYHTRCKLEFLSNPEELLFGLQLGCMIDKHNPAFAYDANGVKRPILAHGGIFNGVPRLFPMPLDSRGRWTGEVP